MSPTVSQRRTHLTGQINTIGTLRHEGDARVFSVRPRHIAAKARENNQQWIFLAFGMKARVQMVDCSDIVVADRLSGLKHSYASTPEAGGSLAKSSARVGNFMVLLEHIKRRFR